MPVLLIEPASDAKRRHLSSMLRESAGSQVTQEDVEQRLKDLRTDSLAHLDTLLAQLIAGFSSGPGLEVTFAADASQAVEAILRIAGSSEIAVNKSAVVTNELVPALAASGREVILSYPQEFLSPESVPSEYWELADIPFGSRFSAFERTVDLAASRARSLETNGATDLVALVGVNAISVDGTILMLQHMQNIRKVFEQAKEVIFVAGIDKIVAGADDAVFQTQCMAAYGCEVLPLGFSAGKGGRSSEESPSQASCEPGPAPFHLVLLDNGRSRIMRGRYPELLTCIDCRACIKECPGSRFFATDARWSPRDYLYFSVAGRSSSLDQCLQCKTCQANCPLHIDIPGMIVERKAELLRNHRRSLTDFVLSRGGSMERWGSVSPRLANLFMGAAPFRWVGDISLGISRQRQLPFIGRRSFARWYASRTARN